jgi:hypothetical protein
VLVLALLGVPKLADACSCAALGTVKVLPGTRDPAPTNTHLLLEVPLAGYLEEHNIKPDNLQVTLRGPKGTVPLDVRRWGDAGFRWVELVPKLNLAPNTRYTAQVSVDNGKDSYLGQVTTGDGPDQTSPAFEGVSKGVLVKQWPHPGGCATGRPFVVLTLGDVKDDTAPAAAIRFHVWLADDKGGIDYSRPPTATVAARGGEIWLGQPFLCTPETFVVPDRPSFKVGVKAVDLAGNMSEPSETVISVPPPPKGRRPDIGKAAAEEK